MNTACWGMVTGVESLNDGRADEEMPFVVSDENGKRQMPPYMNAVTDIWDKGKAIRR